MARWWKENSELVAAAIDEAETLSGHQIVVWVGDLGWRPNRSADRLAVKYEGASLVFCVDPRRRRFELRWASGLTLDSEAITNAAREGLRAHDLPKAINDVAAVLPRQAEGEEMPDIVEQRRDNGKGDTAI